MKKLLLFALFSCVVTSQLTVKGMEAETVLSQPKSKVTIINNTDVEIFIAVTEAPRKVKTPSAVRATQNSFSLNSKENTVLRLPLNDLSVGEIGINEKFSFPIEVLNEMLEWGGGIVIDSISTKNSKTQIDYKACKFKRNKALKQITLLISSSKEIIVEHTDKKDIFYESTPVNSGEVISFNSQIPNLKLSDTSPALLLLRLSDLTSLVDSSGIITVSWNEQMNKAEVSYSFSAFSQQLSSSDSSGEKNDSEYFPEEDYSQLISQLTSPIDIGSGLQREIDPTGGLQREIDPTGQNCIVS